MGSRVGYDKYAQKEGIRYWSCFSTVELADPRLLGLQQIYTEVSFSYAAVSLACETQWEDVEMS